MRIKIIILALLIGFGFKSYSQSLTIEVTPTPNSENTIVSLGSESKDIAIKIKYDSDPLTDVTIQYYDVRIYSRHEIVGFQDWINERKTTSEEEITYSFTSDQEEWTVFATAYYNYNDNIFSVNSTLYEFNVDLGKSYDEILSVSNLNNYLFSNDYINICEDEEIIVDYHNSFTFNHYFSTQIPSTILCNLSSDGEMTYTANTESVYIFTLQGCNEDKTVFGEKITEEVTDIGHFDIRNFADYNDFFLGEGNYYKVTTQVVLKKSIEKGLFCFKTSEIESSNIVNHFFHIKYNNLHLNIDYTHFNSINVISSSNIVLEQGFKYVANGNNIAKFTLEDCGSQNKIYEEEKENSSLEYLTKFNGVIINSNIALESIENGIEVCETKNLKSDNEEFNLKIDIIGNEFNIYPNPTTSNLTISFTGAEEFSYSVYDQLGRLIQSGTGVNSENIDLSDESNGIYFVKLISGEEVITKKIIKQ